MHLLLEALLVVFVALGSYAPTTQVHAISLAPTSTLPAINTTCDAFLTAPTHYPITFNLLLAHGGAASEEPDLTEESDGCNVTLADASTAAESLPKVDVKITSTGNTAVQAAITNNGDYDLSIMKLNSIFDRRRVRKIEVNSSADGLPLPFLGISVTPSRQTNDDSWLQLAKGKVFATEFDAADLYDLSAGGNYTVRAEGCTRIQNATGYSDLLLNYSSNVLEMEVDGAEAAKGKAAAYDREMESPDADATIGGSCDDEKATKIREALGYCSDMSRWGAWGADTADIRFSYYFNTDFSAVRNFVRCKLLAVAEECREGNGRTWFTCNDAMQECDYDTLAVTNHRNGRITLCELTWVVGAPVFTNECHAWDLATTLIHEMTHVNNLHTGDGTIDVPCHDMWPQCKQLDWERAIRNAETYSSYVQSIYLLCGWPY